MWGTVSTELVIPVKVEHKSDLGASFTYIEFAMVISVKISNRTIFGDLSQSDKHYWFWNKVNAETADI